MLSDHLIGKKQQSIKTYSNVYLLSVSSYRHSFPRPYWPTTYLDIPWNMCFTKVSDFLPQLLLVHHRASQSPLKRGTWLFLGLLLSLPCAMGWSLATSSRVSLCLVGETVFPCSTQQQAPSHWEDSHQPPPTTAQSLPVTSWEVDQLCIWSLQHRMMVSAMKLIHVIINYQCT